MNEVVVTTESHLRSLIADAVRSALETVGAPDVHGEILTREQVAELIQVHPAVVTRYAHRRGLPGFKLGREWRFRRGEVMKWLEASR